MERKFLAVSGVVLLIAIGYFIFTSLKDPSLLKNQHKLSEESDRAFGSRGTLVKRDSSRLFAPSNPKNSDPEPTAEEGQAFKEPLHRRPEEEDSGEERAQALTSETQTDDTGISPELEAIFIAVNEWRRRIRSLHQTADPLVRQGIALNDRRREIGNALNGTSSDEPENRRLHEQELKIVSEQQELGEQVVSIDKEIERNREELEQYLQTNLAMTTTQFYDTHGEVFHAWRKAQ